MREERLESWKEISAYLNRGIRTVQRWEKSEGLPVHRHTHEKLGSVYAYRSEIDAWWESRRASLGAAEANGEQSPASEYALSLRPGKMLLAAAAVSVVLFAVVALPTIRSHAIPHGPLTPVALTTLPGSELFPSASPDGSSVVFSWAAPGRPVNLYVTTLGAAAPRRLTESGKGELGASWSPDGSRIAFLRGRPTDGPLGEVIVVNADGSGERRVAQSERDWGPYFAWTPDSRGLIYSSCRAPNPCVLRLLWLESGKEIALTEPKPGMPGDSAPSLSPDGSGLLFVRRTGTATAVYLQKFNSGFRASGSPIAMTPSTVFATAPAWAADGHSFFYMTGVEGVGMKLWRMRPVPGETPVLLAALGDTLYEPAITVSGRRLITVDLRCDFNIHAASLELGRLPSRITDSNRSDTFPHYSPDGRRVAFESSRAGGSDIFIADANGSSVAQLTFFGTRRAETPRWSPDGSEIVFSVGASPGDLYTVPATGGKPRLLLGGPEDDFLPTWSPDGRWIYFTSTRGGTEEIWKIPVSGGPPIRITSGGGFRPVTSEDGRYVYYTRRSRHAAHGAALWRARATGGGEELALDVRVFHPENFEVVGKTIYFMARGALHAFDTATGDVRELTSIARPAGKGLTVDPARRAILYSQLDHHDADLVAFDVR